MYDIAIVGAGPAGLSAAMTARMRNLSCIVIGSNDQSAWLSKAHRVDNYPGLPGTSGQHLLDVFRTQAKDLGIDLKQGVVRQIMPLGKTFMLLCENEIVEAKSIILAMGAARPKPLPGESELLGSGVSYCATCDGMFFKQKNIAVLSSSAAGLHEAAFLAGIARTVDYYLLKAHPLDDADSRIHVQEETPQALNRSESGICLELKEHTSRLYDGIFILRPAVAMTTLLPSLKTEGAFVPVDRHMATNLSGIYACGDLTGHPLQVAKAVGEGNIAAISCADYLSQTK